MITTKATIESISAAGPDHFLVTLAFCDDFDARKVPDGTAGGCCPPLARCLPRAQLILARRKLTPVFMAKVGQEIDIEIDAIVWNDDLERMWNESGGDGRTPALMVDAQAKAAWQRWYVGAARVGLAGPVVLATAWADMPESARDVWRDAVRPLVMGVGIAAMTSSGLAVEAGEESARWAHQRIVELEDEAGRLRVELARRTGLNEGAAPGLNDAIGRLHGELENMLAAIEGALETAAAAGDNLGLWAYEQGQASILKAILDTWPSVDARRILAAVRSEDRTPRDPPARFGDPGGVSSDGSGNLHAPISSADAAEVSGEIVDDAAPASGLADRLRAVVRDLSGRSEITGAGAARLHSRIDGAADDEGRFAAEVGALVHELGQTRQITGKAADALRREITGGP